MRRRVDRRAHSSSGSEGPPGRSKFPRRAFFVFFFFLCLPVSPAVPDCDRGDLTWKPRRRRVSVSTTAANESHPGPALQSSSGNGSDRRWRQNTASNAAIGWYREGQWQPSMAIRLKCRQLLLPASRPRLAHSRPRVQGVPCLLIGSQLPACAPDGLLGLIGANCPKKKTTPDPCDNERGQRPERPLVVARW